MRLWAMVVALLIWALAWKGDPIVEAAPAQPGSGSVSQLQARVDAAPDGATVTVGPGTYPGGLIIQRRLRLVGRGRPLLLGSESGSVIQVRAPGVVIKGFNIDGLGQGDLGQDDSGIHVAASDATVHDCRISNTVFGVYLRQADRARVQSCVIRGIPGKEPGEKGSGIHVWNTQNFVLLDNEIVEVRDGFYIQSSSHGRIAGNRVRDIRYGLHYMYSDDNVFDDNRFENGAAGAALMYSKRIAFRHNRFLHNRGFASVGLLLKTCDDVLAEENLIADNARGIFVEGSYHNRFRRNVIASADTAIVLYDSCGDNQFEGNSFVANLSPLLLVGRRTDTRFDGNYWSDNQEPDLDGDGRSDRPYRLSSVFDHFRGNLTAADLFSQGFAAAALGAAERTFPVLEPVAALDRAPLVRPPELPIGLQRISDRGPVHAGGLLGSAASLLLGGAGLGYGLRTGRQLRRIP
jgi:nitrous oxidase accessory protein